MFSIRVGTEVFCIAYISGLKCNMLNFLHCMTHSAVCQFAEGLGPFAGVLGQRATWTFTD